MRASIRLVRTGVVFLVLFAVSSVRPVTAAEKKVPTGAVTGQVHYKGQPLPAGTVGFHPAKGKPVFAKIQPNGRYSAPAVPAGTVRITIETKSPRPKPGAPVNKNYVAIPEKYAKPRTSGIEFTVQKGKSELNIELK